MTAFAWFLVFMMCFCGLTAVSVFWAWYANDAPATPHVGPDELVGIGVDMPEKIANWAAAVILVCIAAVPAVVSLSVVIWTIGNVELFSNAIR